MKISKQLRNELLGQVAAFFLLVLSVSLLWRNNLVLFVVALTEGVIALYLWHERHDLSFLLVIGGMGSVAEAVFVRFGAWHYANPSVLGIPLWFPLSFGTAGLIGGRMSRTIVKIWEELCPSR